MNLQLFYVGYFFVLILIAYLLGSISSAIIVCKIFNLPDPRSSGSNNPGATNVLRIGGKSKAAMVLIFDMLKGLLPILLVKYGLLYEPITQGMYGQFDFFVVSIVGLSAVLGHVFPVFYQWKGGKGVATALGVYWGLSLGIGALCVIAWLIVFKFFRYSSLASLVMVALAPIYAVFLLPETMGWIPLLFIAFLIFFKHRSNIQRLYNGTEPTFKK